MTKFSESEKRLSSPIGSENEVAVDDDANRKSRADGDRPLDVEVSADDLLAGLIEACRGAAPKRLEQVVLRVGRAAQRTAVEFWRGRTPSSTTFRISSLMS